MSTYGLVKTGGAGPGSIPFTGWTPTLGNETTTRVLGGGTSAGHVYRNGLTHHDIFFARQVRKVGSDRATWIQLLRILENPIGQQNGYTWRRVNGQTQPQTVPPNPQAGINTTPVTSAPKTMFGGLVPIQTVASNINRATTNADVNAFAALIRRFNFPSPYARDVSGNGGGGKQTGKAF